MSRHFRAPQEGWVGRDREKMQVRVRGCGSSLLSQLKPREGLSRQGSTPKAATAPKSRCSPQQLADPIFLSDFPVFFPLQLPKHSKKKPEQSPAGPGWPDGRVRALLPPAGAPWDPPEPLRYGHHKTSPGITKLICTEVYPSAPFPFARKENPTQPRHCLGFSEA